MKYLLLTVFIVSSWVSQAQQKQWTLTECVNYALENNITIQQTSLDIQDSEWQMKSAKGNFLPTASANANHAWNKGLTTNITTNQLEEQTVQNTSVGASIGIDIFRGLQNLNQFHRANLVLLASQYQLDDMKDDISLRVANSFLQILFNKESLKVFQSQLAITNKELIRTRELITNGVVPEGDILEIEASAASQEQQIVDAENAVRISKIGLSQLLQLKDYENFEIANDSYDIPTSEVINRTPDEVFEKALQTRKIIRISETNVDIAEQDYELSKAGYYPTLSGYYSFNTRASNNDKIDRTTGVVSDADPVFDQFDRNKGQSIGLQLSIPIFSQFKNNVNLQRRRLGVERAKLDLEQTKVNLESNVHQAYNDARGSLKAYHAAEKTVIARRQAFEYAESRHEVGVINSFEFQRTKQLLESAESDVIRTKYDYIFKLKILEFYFGIPIAQQ